LEKLYKLQKWQTIFAILAIIATTAKKTFAIVKIEHVCLFVYRTAPVGSNGEI
jgi:hypothetical protein